MQFTKTFSDFEYPAGNCHIDMLVRRETPRLCRGGSKSLTAPAVFFSIQVPRPLALRFGACDFDLGSRQGPFEGPATRKASGFAGGYLLEVVCWLENGG